MSEEKNDGIKYPPLVYVTWEDIKVIEGGAWIENKKRDYTPHIFHQVGFLILDEPQGIHLTAAWHPELISPPDQIPRQVIRSITYLEPKSTPVKGTRNASSKNPRRGIR